MISVEIRRSEWMRNSCGKLLNWVTGKKCALGWIGLAAGLSESQIRGRDGLDDLDTDSIDIGVMERLSGLVNTANPEEPDFIHFYEHSDLANSIITANDGKFYRSPTGPEDVPLKTDKQREDLIRMLGKQAGFDITFVD